MGGIGTQLWPARYGRWNHSAVPMVAVGSKEVYSSGQCLRTAVPSNDYNCVPPPSVPWYLPMDMSPVQGPVAMYRGDAMHRAVPPPTNVSLPHVSGGRWSCNTTSLQGAFMRRPSCRMECDDPTHVAVDRKVEHWLDESSGNELRSARLSGSGWYLAASISRVWWSYWTGFPGLLQDELVVPRHDALAPFQKASVRRGLQHAAPPTYRKSDDVSFHNLPGSPAVECLPDAPTAGVSSWRTDTRWAQREPASTATVELTLRFDRNSWLPSIQVDPAFATPPGLSYPVPTRA